MMNREKNESDGVDGGARGILRLRQAQAQNDKQRARKEKLRHIRKSIEQLEADKNAFINLLHRARSQSRVSLGSYVI